MSSEPADFLDAMAEYQRQIVLAAGLGSEVFMLSGAVVVIARHGYHLASMHVTCARHTETPDAATSRVPSNQSGCTLRWSLLQSCISHSRPLR